MNTETTFDLETFLMDMVESKNRGLITTLEFVINIERVVTIMHERHGHLWEIEEHEMAIKTQTEKIEWLKLRAQLCTKQLNRKMK